MPCSTPEEQREYQRAWLRKRRDEWFNANGPCRDCGSWEDLELDHIDPAKKVSHRVWSWAEYRRNAELAKCQPLCNKCHVEKSRLAAFKFHKFPDHGTRHRYVQGCRCDPCREDNALRERERTSRTGRGSTFYRHRKKSIPL